MDSLSSYLEMERKRYLEACEEEGGTARGYREHITGLKAKDPMLFRSWEHEALMEAATKKWETPPRKKGIDLFSINGVEIPEHLTRTTSVKVEMEGEEEEEEGFEKVDAYYATVNDLQEDAIIGMRNAARASAAAERKMKTVDEAKRRAKWQMDVLLRNISDS